MNETSDLTQYIRNSCNGLSPPKHSRLKDLLMTSHKSHSINNRENEPPFCDGSNLTESIEYLDKEFQILGLGSLYSKQGEFELHRLLNTTYTLLRRQQQSSRYREDLENRLCQYSSDMDHAQGSLRKSKHNNTALQNEINKLQENERQHKKHSADLTSKLKSHTEEIRRLKSQLQSNENQYKHELKKKERQLDKIKERAHYLLTDKSRPGGAAGIDISSCLNRIDGSRGKWRIDSNNRNEEELQSRILVNMEMRCATLLTENNNMRQMLSDVHREVTQLASHTESLSKNRVHPDEMNLPMDTVQGRISGSLKSNCAKLLKSLNSGAQDDDLKASNPSPRRMPLSPDKHVRTRKTCSVLSCSLDSTRSGSTLRTQDDLNKTYEVEDNSRSPRPNNRASPRKQERIVEHINQLKKALDIHRSPTKNPHWGEDNST